MAEYNNFGSATNHDDIYDEEFTSTNNNNNDPENNITTDRSIKLIPETKSTKFSCFKHERFYPLAIFEGRITKRQCVSILAFTGLMITFGMRCNLPIATGARKPCSQADIAALNKLQQETTETTDKNQENAINNNPCSNPNGEKVFNWTSIEIGLVQSAFFYGYCITQIPAGLLASLYPTNKLFGFSILCTACLNLLIPIVIGQSKMAVVVIRIAQGLVEGIE